MTVKTPAIRNRKAVVLQPRDFIPHLVIAAVLCVAVFAFPGRQEQRIIAMLALWAMAAASWNIIMGYAGQLALGHSAFVGIGAFTSVFLLRGADWTPWIGMLIGAAIAAAAAFAIGAPTFRLAGIFFGLAALTYPLIMIIILDYLGYTEVTIPRKMTNPTLWMQFTEPRVLSLVSVAFLVLTLALVQALEKSRFGYSARAIRQNPAAAEAMGVHAFFWKSIAFVVSAFVAALMGAIYVNGILLIATPDALFGLPVVLKIVAIGTVGGLNSVWGPLIGAVLLVPASELLDAQVGYRFPGLQTIVYGVGLIVATLWAPDGIYARVRNLWAVRRVSAEPGESEEPAAETSGQSPATFLSDIEGGPGQVAEADVPSVTRSASREPILRVEGLSRSFGTVQAMQEVDFSVDAGSIFGIIGPNGAGKTTLFNVLNGFLRADAGHIWFNGEQMRRAKPHTMCRRGMGRTFQTPQTFLEFSVVENVMLPAFVRSHDCRGAQRIAEELIVRLGLDHKAYAPANQLTILEVKLMEIARALASDPKMILLDEPMGGLTPTETEFLGRVLTQIHSETGVALLVIEHKVSALKEIAHRMMVLDHGRQIAEGTGKEVTTAPAVIEAYLGARWQDDAQRP